jgi:hypothetical protein
LRLGESLFDLAKFEGLFRLGCLQRPEDRQLVLGRPQMKDSGQRKESEKKRLLVSPFFAQETC